MKMKNLLYDKIFYCKIFHAAQLTGLESGGDSSSSSKDNSGSRLRLLQGTVSYKQASQVRQ